VLKGELNIVSEMSSGWYFIVSHFVFKTKNCLIFNSSPFYANSFFNFCMIWCALPVELKGRLSSGFLCYLQVNAVVIKDKCCEQTECDNQGQTKLLT